MKDAHNEFYSSIAKYYHEIFPFNPVQLQFVREKCGSLSAKKILDIGCATGELAFHLSEHEAEVTGIDLNEDLLHQAQLRETHPRLTFQKGDMLKLEEDFHPWQFDGVLCFGNTLVHLPSEEQVKKMLQGVAGVLRPGGVFLLQILNYDYILDEQVTELPVIETENIKFVRKYAIEPGNPLIRFETELFLKKEDKVIYNETPLLALRSEALVNLLDEMGFKDVALFSSFRGGKFGGKHLPLVASAFL